MTAVLITGGTGSFGCAFTKRLLGMDNITRVCIYSRDEHGQAGMREDLGPNSKLRWFIGDVRDLDRLRRAMNGVDWVIHAAALKRIEVCEYDPIEVVKTNVAGAVNVIEAATDARVRKVVALSTDKACDPVNAYGASKMLAEKLFLAANNARGATGPIFAVTRYGNIAGSQGSVIPRWRKLIASGAKVVPVTDPDCTRFWMTIDQAVDLVLNTITSMKGGELNVPTLPAYRLGDLAEAMGVGIDVIGIDPHEKRHESMIPGKPSNIARRMTVEEIRQGLATL